MVKQSERISFCFLMIVGLLLMTFLPLYYLSVQKEFRFNENTTVLSAYQDIPDQAREINQEELFAGTEESENQQEKLHKHFPSTFDRNATAINNVFSFEKETPSQREYALLKRKIPLHLRHCAFLI